MTEYKVGMVGSVNGKLCKIKNIDTEGPLSHLLLVEFAEGRDCLRTIESPEGRTAYVSKKSFACSAPESDAVCCPCCGKVFEKIVYRCALESKNDKFSCSCGKVWTRYEVANGQD